MLGLSLHLRSNRVALVGGSSTRRASSMVSANSSVSEPVSCVLLPGVDRKQLAENAQKLEAEAAAAHKAAQQLNKEGRYEEAKVQYAEMRRLDAEALQITRQLGCQQCMPDSATIKEAAAVSAGEQLGPAEQALYEQLHTPSPWPSTSQQGPIGVAERAKGAIVACLMCDAAATGVQWIYDMELLAQLQQQRQQETGGGLEFFDPVQSPFLSGYSSGRNSPYGEQTLLLLRSLAEQGGLDCGHYAQLYYDSYSDGFEGYMNASTVAFLRTYGRGLRPPATGADDAQADCIARLAPLVSMFAGDPRLMEFTAAATRVTQDTVTAVAWACAGAAVLERLLLGQGAAAAVRETVQELQQEGPGRMSVDRQEALQVASHLERVLQLQATPHAGAVEAMGRNCHLPNSCQTPLHAVLYFEQQWHSQVQQQQQQRGAGAGHEDEAAVKQQVLMDVVRAALAAGGCCASRASFVGACMGALLGPESVPAAWLSNYEAAGSVQGWADAVCSSRE